MSIVAQDHTTLPRYISLAEAAKALPSYEGQGIHVASLHRWATHGVAGVRLRYVMVGRCRCTTVGWLNEFLAAVTEAKERATGRSVSQAGAARTPRTETRAARQARERAEKANRELEAIGM